MSDEATDEHFRANVAESYLEDLQAEHTALLARLEALELEWGRRIDHLYAEKQLAHGVAIDRYGSAIRTLFGLQKELRAAINGNMP